MEERIDTSLHLADFNGIPVRHDDRRREPRVVCDRPIAILPYHEPRFLNGRFTDCSVNGVGVLLQQALPVDERFLLKLRGESVTLLIYVIRSCLPIGDSYRIGGELCGCIGTAANVGDRGILKMLLGGTNLECL
jgi:hypothetical protein